MPWIPVVLVESVVEVVLLPDGESLSIPKQPVQRGEPLGGEFPLGRCVQLSKQPRHRGRRPWRSGRRPSSLTPDKGHP